MGFYHALKYEKRLSISGRLLEGRDHFNGPVINKVIILKRIIGKLCNK
jgi:hypothetical protein